MFINFPGCLFTLKILILDPSWISLKYLMCIKRVMLRITRFSFKNLLFPLLACSFGAKNSDRTSGFAKKSVSGLNVKGESCQVRSVNDRRFFSLVLWF